MIRIRPEFALRCCATVWSAFWMIQQFDDDADDYHEYVDGEFYFKKINSG